MRYREIGKTSLVVSDIGFGTWPLSGDSHGSLAYGKTDDTESIAALQLAYRCGINFFDTADLYGYGHVENLLSKALGSVRDKIIIASKVGMINNDSDTDLSTLHIFESINGSLKRLNTDYLDLYLLHSPKIEQITDEVINTLQSLKKAGKIRYYGLSTKAVADGFPAVEKFKFDVIETNYSIMDNRCDKNGLLDLCAKTFTGVIARTPLSQGIITGEFTYNNDSTDRRNSIPRETYDRLTSAYSEIVNSMKDKFTTKAQTALRFCLSHPAVSSVIPGMKTRTEVMENCYASEFGPLSSDELNSIKNICKMYSL